MSSGHDLIGVLSSLHPSYLPSSQFLLHLHSRVSGGSQGGFAALGGGWRNSDVARARLLDDVVHHVVMVED